jgi:CheY-like chemotaxis protein
VGNIYLIADDLSVNNLILSKLLQKVDDDCVVLSHKSAHDLLQTYAEMVESNYVPSAIFLDEIMPSMTGTDCAKMLRNNEFKIKTQEYKGLIAIITGESDPMKLKDNIIIDEVLPKPINLTDLNDLLSEHACI